MGLLQVPRNIVDRVLPLLLNWKRESEVHERVKGDGDLGGVSLRVGHHFVVGWRSYLRALGTYECALILSLKQIDDDTVISKHVSIPRFSSELNEFAISSTLPVRFLHVRLLQNAIQIFVKAIK